MGSSPHLWFCACKTETLALELKVSVGQRPNVWFLHVKQRLWDQNNYSLWVPDMTSCLRMYNSVLSIRITSLHGSQPSSVVMCFQKRDFRTRIAYLYGSQHSSAVLCSQKSDFRTLVACLHWPQTTPVISCLQNGMPSIRITSLYGFQPSSEVFGCKTATLERNNKSLWVPDLICGFVHSKERL